jgi:hypothetical protein
MGDDGDLRGYRRVVGLSGVALAALRQRSSISISSEATEAFRPI